MELAREALHGTAQPETAPPDPSFTGRQVAALLLLAVALAPVIVTPALLGLLIVAWTVSVASRIASLRTVTVWLPVVAPCATLTAAAPPNAVKSEPLVAEPPLLASVNVIGAPLLFVAESVTV